MGFYHSDLIAPSQLSAVSTWYFMLEVQKGFVIITVVRKVYNGNDNNDDRNDLG